MEQDYLESLVKKGEEIVEEAVVEELEQSIDVEEPEEVAEEVIEEDAEEEVAEEAEEVAEPKPAQEAAPEVTEVKKEAAPADDEIVYVENIRIFNTPDPNTVSKLFSGNVIRKGQQGEMVAIEYMRPGIGLVAGFTPSL